MKILRPRLRSSIQDALFRSPVVVLTGPRQVGKTTLARTFLPPESPAWFDLEDPVSLARLDEPMTALRPLRGLVVIDEIQRRPDLFPVLRVLADRDSCPAQFLILGSAAGELERQSSESLSGRIERIAVHGFHLEELGAEAVQTLWLRGGFPRAQLAIDDAEAARWLDQFLVTLLERDLPQWGVRIPASSLRRFWAMLAHWHGQIWKASEPARALQVSEPTCRRYLDVLTDALMIRVLQPWHANLAKRQVKSPKLYFRDSGILHRLLGIQNLKALLEHPRLGASFEGFVIEQVLAREPHDDAYFWATHQGAEIDLLLLRGQDLYGIEIKHQDAPRMTPSLKIALEDLKLKGIAVLYPGSVRYRLHDRVEVIPLTELAGNAPLFQE